MPNISLLTVSDTRTLNDDKSGDVLKQKYWSGHFLYERKIVEDDVMKIQILQKNGLKTLKLKLLFQLGALVSREEM